MVWSWPTGCACEAANGSFSLRGPASKPDTRPTEYREFGKMGKNQSEVGVCSIWRSYGCAVEVSTEDITTAEGCLSLIKAAQRLGPVQAIFNLAVVLSDCILANQTEQSFRVSFAPKACATKYLDEVSRQHCPELRYYTKLHRASGNLKLSQSIENT